MNQFDVAIIGTGPAGGAAAMELAGSGLKVALIEKQTLPRYKTCGGGILHRATRLLPIDISPVVEHQCFRVAMNLSDRLRFSVERSTPIVSMVMRDDFDHLLVKSATDRGVHLLADCEVRGVHPTPDEVKLITSRGDFSARFVIAADGAAGRIGKLAGFADHRFVIPATEAEVIVDDATFARFALEARFDFDAIPFGYGWVFPKRNHLSIGVGTWQKGIDLKSHLNAYLNRFAIQPIKIETHGFVIPTLGVRASARMTFAANRILLTGDAAGLADPVTAEGITYAIGSGQLAARAIRDNFPDANQVERGYINELTNSILPDLRCASRLARLLYFHPRFRNLAFRFAGQRLTELMTRIVMGESTYTRELLRSGL